MEATKNNGNGENPMMDERIVYINEVLGTKLSAISSGKREAVKREKPICRYILDNWDNAEINGGLKKIVDDEDVKVLSYKLWCIAKSRYDQLVALAAKELEDKMKLEEGKKKLSYKVPREYIGRYKELKEKHRDAVILFRNGNEYLMFGEDIEKAYSILKLGVTKEKGIYFIKFSFFSLDTYLPKLIRAGLRVAINETNKPKKEEAGNGNKTGEARKTTVATAGSTKPATEVKDTVKKGKAADNKRKVGDKHPSKPWVWVEYKPGKFDWRADKSAKSEDKKESAVKVKPVKSDNKPAESVQEHDITIKEFLSLVSKNGKKGLTDNHKNIIKLLQKGYHFELIGKSIFLQDYKGHSTAVNTESLKALLKRYKIQEIPEKWIEP